MGMRQKIFFFFAKKNSKWRLKKRSFFNSVNSQYVFVKISWIVPWVSRIVTNCHGDEAKKNYFFEKKYFCLIPMTISHKLCVRMDGTQFLLL